MIKNNATPPSPPPPPPETRNAPIRIFARKLFLNRVLPLPSPRLYTWTYSSLNKIFKIFKIFKMARRWEVRTAQGALKNRLAQSAGRFSTFFFFASPKPGAGAPRAQRARPQCMRAPYYWGAHNTRHPRQAPGFPTTRT